MNYPLSERELSGRELGSVTRRALLRGAAALTLQGVGAITLAGCGRSQNPKLQPPPPTAAALPDVVDMLASLKSGTESAQKLAQNCVALCERLNPKVNALAFRDFERAKLATDLPVGAYQGIPIAIKDLFDWPGMPTSFGSRGLANQPAQTPTPFGKKLKSLGFNAIGKSTTPEFGLTATTEPALTGPTRNPFDLERSAGGSSGGAAALVASGILAIAHASDGGGSIRIPAACCGLVGLKPSWGRFPTEGGTDRRRKVTELSVQGVLTRSVRDTAWFLDAMEEKGGDAYLRPVGRVNGPSGEHLRIGISINAMNGQAPDAEVAAAVQMLANKLAKLGHQVEMKEGILNDPAIPEAFGLIWAAKAAQKLDDWSRATGKKPSPDLFEPWTLGLADMFAQNRGKLDDAIAAANAYAFSWESRFTAQHLIMTPVLSRIAVPIGYLSSDLPFFEHQARVSAYAPYTAIANIAGAPAITVPIAMSASGLPIGVQFLAPVGGEKRLLEIAYAIEEMLPWRHNFPRIWAG